MGVPWDNPREYIQDLQGKQDAFQSYARTHPGAIDYSRAVDDPRGVMSDIIRSQWEDFQGSTVPIIKGLEQMTTYGGNKGVVEGLKTDARLNAKAAFGNVMTNAKQDAQSYGMSLTPQAKGTLARAANLGLAAATTDGVNRANDYQMDLNRQIAAGGNALSPLDRGK